MMCLYSSTLLPQIKVDLSLSDDSFMRNFLLIRYFTYLQYQVYKTVILTIYANCYMYISFSLKVSFKTCKTKFTVFPCEIRKLSSPPSLLLSWVSFSPITLCSKIFYKNLESIGPNSEIVVLLKNKISIALGIRYQSIKC